MTAAENDDEWRALDDGALVLPPFFTCFSGAGALPFLDQSCAPTFATGAFTGFLGRSCTCTLAAGVFTGGWCTTGALCFLGLSCTGKFDAGVSMGWWTAVELISLSHSFGFALQAMFWSSNLQFDLTWEKSTREPTSSFFFFSGNKDGKIKQQLLLGIFAKLRNSDWSEAIRSGTAWVPLFISRLRCRLCPF